MNKDMVDKDFQEKIDYLKDRAKNLKQKVNDQFVKRLDAYNDFAEDAEKQIN